MSQSSRPDTCDQASAKYQTDKPDFCGVDVKVHEAFCAGWEAAVHNIKAYSVWGSDDCANNGCQNRITLFVRDTLCLECQAKDSRPAPMEER